MPVIPNEFKRKHNGESDEHNRRHHPDFSHRALDHLGTAAGGVLGFLTEDVPGAITGYSLARGAIDDRHGHNLDHPVHHPELYPGSLEASIKEIEREELEQKYPKSMHEKFNYLARQEGQRAAYAHSRAGHRYQYERHKASNENDRRQAVKSGKHDLKRLVQRMLSKPLFVGEYRNTDTNNIKVTTADQWTVLYQDNIAQTWDIGGYARILDAASICWNGKVASQTSWQTATGNLPSIGLIDLVSIQSTYEVHNCSQLPLIMEFYANYPKSQQDLGPFPLWNQGYSQINGTHIGTVGATASGQEIGSYFRESPAIRSAFHTKIKRVKVLPGEAHVFKVYLKGKKIYLGRDMKNGGTVATPLFSTYDNRVPLCSTFFRFRPIIAVGTNFQSVTPTEVGVGGNGVSVLQQTRYYTRCPASLTTSVVNQPNVYSYSGFGTISAGTEIPQESPGSILTSPA